MKAYWHVYHNQGFSNNIQERIDYVKRHKPVYEIDLRLTLLKPVRGKLPRVVVKTGEALNNARIVCDKLWAACNEAWITHPKIQKACEKGQMICREAWAVYIAKRDVFGKAVAVYEKVAKAHDEAIETYQAEIEALHREECPNCPWDGKTIFPREEEEDAAV